MKIHLVGHYVLLIVVLIHSASMADILAAWDVEGVDVKAGSGVDNTSHPYGLSAETKSVHVQNSQLTLGFDAPSDATGLYGFKFSAATHQNSLADAIANNHYIQFNLIAETGYQFNLTSIEMNGQSGSSGPDDIALLSDIEEFAEGNEIATLAGRQGITGGWDTDASGWGSLIDLTSPQYQALTTVTFRIYGWNSTGTASAGIRNLSGNDLVINGTMEAVPEPAVLTFISLSGLGFLFVRRLLFSEA